MLLTQQINELKWVIASLTDKKSCKKQKMDILKKSCLVLFKKKNLYKTCQKKKKTRLKSIKEKDISN